MLKVSLRSAYWIIMYKSMRAKITRKCYIWKFKKKLRKLQEVKLYGMTCSFVL